MLLIQKNCSVMILKLNKMQQITPSCHKLGAQFETCEFENFRANKVET